MFRDSRLLALAGLPALLSTSLLLLLSMLYYLVRLQGIPEGFGFGVFLVSQLNFRDETVSEVRLCTCHWPSAFSAVRYRARRHVGREPSVTKADLLHRAHTLEVRTFCYGALSHIQAHTSSEVRRVAQVSQRHYQLYWVW